MSVLLFALIFAAGVVLGAGMVGIAVHSFARPKRPKPKSPYWTVATFAGGGSIATIALVNPHYVPEYPASTQQHRIDIGNASVTDPERN